jgi:hypothetical protein
LPIFLLDPIQPLSYTPVILQTRFIDGRFTKE